MEHILGGGLLAMAVGGLGKAITYLGDDIDSPNGPVSSVSYTEFKRKAKTGDMIFTSCPTSISRVFTKSMWSHCGMVWRDPETDEIYEWSSHMADEGLPNSSGEKFGGTQLVPLFHLAADNGTVYWRPIHLSSAQRKKVYEFVEKTKYKVEFSSYPEFAAYLGRIPAKLFNGFGTGMVCSHTVAATYLFADALALDRHLTQFAPETFSPSGDASWTVPVAPCVSMVVSYDMSELISLGPLSPHSAHPQREKKNYARGPFSKPERSGDGVPQADKGFARPKRGIPKSRHGAAPIGGVLVKLPQARPVQGGSRCHPEGRPAPSSPTVPESSGMAYSCDLT